MVLEMSEAVDSETRQASTRQKVPMRKAVATSMKKNSGRLLLV